MSLPAAEPAAKETRTLSLSECISMALEHNLDVQIQRIGPQIARFSLDAYSGAYDPNFSMSYTHGFVSSPGGTDSNAIPLPAAERTTDDYTPQLNGTLPGYGTRYSLLTTFQAREGTGVTPGTEHTAASSITLTQPVLKNFLIDNTRQLIEVNRRSLKISEFVLQNQIMTVVTDVQLAYYDLIYAVENVKVQQKALELAERLLSENKKRVEVGAMAPLDEKQAESQFAARKADLIAAERELAARQNALKTLLTDEYLTWHKVFIQPKDSLLAMAEPVDLQDSWRKGLALRPDLQQLKLDLEKKDIVLKYTGNQVLPQLDLVGTVGHNGLGGTFFDTTRDLRRGSNPRHSYGFVFSIPLSNRTSRNNYEASKADKEQSLLKLKKLEQDIVVQIDDAAKTAQSNYERVDATRQARLYAEAALDAEQKKLASGKSTSFVVLQLQRDLTTARSTEIRALADYNQALSRLALSEGTTMDKVKLRVELK
ncbi:MAG TPA: TolC family protein [Roseimicrobium sp.]|nr:TolC family protein [Roseimicrobium sp.]